MIRRILVPLDGSSRAESVLPLVVMIASAFDARLDLLHVLPGGSTVGRGKLSDPLAYRLAQADRTSYLEGRAAELSGKGIQVKTLIQEGGAAEVIVDLLRSGVYDLVGLTSHGAGCGRHLRLGCTTVAVILNARSSILLAPAIGVEGGTKEVPSEGAVIRSILAPVDCSARSDWAVTMAGAIARKSGADLQLVHVLGRPEMLNRLPQSGETAALVEKVLDANREDARMYLKQSVWRLKKEDLKVDEHLIEASGGTADALHEYVGQARPDLVVLSAHGRGGSPEWPLGGTAAKLVFWSDRPLLILQDQQSARVRPRLDIERDSRRSSFTVR